MQDPGPFLRGSHKGGYGTPWKRRMDGSRQEGRRAKTAAGPGRDAAALDAKHASTNRRKHASTQARERVAPARSRRCLCSVRRSAEQAIDRFRRLPDSETVRMLADASDHISIPRTRPRRSLAGSQCSRARVGTCSRAIITRVHVLACSRRNVLACSRRNVLACYNYSRAYSRLHLAKRWNREDNTGSQYRRRGRHSRPHRGRHRS